MPPSGLLDHLLLPITATLLYAMAGGTAWLRLGTAQPWNRTARAVLFGVTAAALASHLALLVRTVYGHGTLDLGLTTVSSLVAWAVCLIFLVTAIRKPIENLAAVIMPIAALTVAMAWRWPAPVRGTDGSGWLVAHVLISIFAYSLLSIAILQALALSLLERGLHERRSSRWWALLPSLQTMETLMFQMIGIGFALLSLTLLSGIFFSEQIFGRPLVWSNHIVLSICAWIVFGALLVGRLRFGWRGQRAVRWAVVGFVLLFFAYLGTRFVLEVAFGH